MLLLTAPRMLRQRKFLIAMEASLLVASRSGGEEALKEFSKKYGSWYQEIDLAVEAVRKRLGL